MKKSQWRVRPGFLLSLLVVFVVIPWVFQAIVLAPRISDKTRAKIIVTRFQIKDIAAALGQRAAEIGSLSATEAGFSFASGSHSSVSRYPCQTNLNGELLDRWETPYKIEILAQTNFIIQSAGQNRKFDDKDDIIFNSVSNDFVKP